MRIRTQVVSLIGLAALQVTASLVMAEESNEPKRVEHLAIIKQWLPSNHDKLQLIFEYDGENPEHQELTSKDLHKSIDKARPTITIIEARNAYEKESRFIGGYNPYRWKNWLGRYEKDAGLFVFDLDKEKKWDRQTSKTRIEWKRQSPSKHGLAFGNGDLVINADLQTGQARNSSFGNGSPQGSILLGQSGTFKIESIRVYTALNEEDVPPAPFRNNFAAASQPPVTARVDDNSSPFFELGLGLLALLLIGVYQRTRL